MPRVGVEKWENEIRLQIQRDQQEQKRIHRKTRDFAEEVQNRWMLNWAESTEGKLAKTEGPHPYETGDYITSIKIKQVKGRKGFSAWEVQSDHPNANFIEYGTGPDKPGSRSPWGPNTPTPEFAPATKTAHYYGGSLD